MARSVTLAALRSRVRTRADMVQNPFVTDPEINQMVSDSYTELYDLVTTTYEDYSVSSAVLNLSSATDTYALPADFYKALGVDAQTGGQTFTLKRFNFSDRNVYKQSVLTSSTLGVTGLRYQLRGANIVFVPTPSGAITATLWYIPAPAVLASDSDAFDGQSGWDEYVVVDAAIKCLQKEESDVSVLMAQKAALHKRILGAARNRDAGMPRTISDTRGY